MRGTSQYREMNYKIYLNNELQSPKSINKIFKSIQNRKILKTRAGFLFKSSINDQNFHIGIRPVIMEGERSHHYDIRLDFENEYVFSGFFNVDGTIGILFTPPGKKEEISSEFKKNLKIVYKNTALILIENGFSENMKLDWISQKIADEIGIFDTSPVKLSDLL